MQNVRLQSRGRKMLGCLGQIFAPLHEEEETTCAFQMAHMPEKTCCLVARETIFYTG
jgi:hypothetical protein